MALQFALTNSFAQEVLKAALAQASLPSLTALYLGVHTANPGREGSSAAEVSTSGTGYARQDILAKLSTASGNGVSFLTERIAFATPTALWGECAYISLNRLSSGGQMLWVGELASPITIDVGSDPLAFEPAQISLGFV